MSIILFLTISTHFSPSLSRRDAFDVEIFSFSSSFEMSIVAMTSTDLSLSIVLTQALSQPFTAIIGNLLMSFKRAGRFPDVAPMHADWNIIVCFGQVIYSNSWYQSVCTHAAACRKGNFFFHDITLINKTSCWIRNKNFQIQHFPWKILLIL